MWSTFLIVFQNVGRNHFLMEIKIHSTRKGHLQNDELGILIGGFTFENGVEMDFTILSSS